MPIDKELNKKQENFCLEYVKNGYNATQAYKTAYQCTDSTASSQGCRLLKNPKVLERIKAIQKEEFQAACITAERVGKKLAEIAFSSKGDRYYNSQAQIKALDLLQKQLGLQQQKIDANVNSTVINVEVCEDEE